MSDKDEKSSSDEFSRHEVMDRSYLLQKMWDTAISNHPFVISDDDLKLLSNRIEDLIADFYQLAGQKFFNSDMKD